MTLRELRVFHAVVANGSIQAAAEAVGLTQSAVTRIIQRLEQDLGVPLFDRGERPVRLTRRGAEAHDHARRVLEAADAMGRAFAPGAMPSGPLRIGISHALAPLALGAGTLFGLARYPDIEPQITAAWSTDLREALQRHRLDLAATITQADEAAPDWLAVTVVARATVRAFAAGQRAAMPQDLRAANARGWALNLEGCGYRRALLDALDRLGERPKLVLQTNSLDLQLATVRAGRAVTVLPEIAVAGLAAAGIRALPAAAFAFDVDVRLLAHRAGAVPDAVAALVETDLRATLAARPTHS